jgi:hypothetical protein
LAEAFLARSWRTSNRSTVTFACPAISNQSLRCDSD